MINRGNVRRLFDHGEGVIVRLAYSLRLSTVTAVATQTCFIQFIHNHSQMTKYNIICHIRFYSLSK